MTHTTVGPCRAAYESALTIAEQAEAQYDAHTSDGSAAGEAEENRLLAVYSAAGEQLDATRAALAESDEPREYTFSGGGGTETYVLSPSEVAEDWQDWMADGDWGDRTKTSWVHGHATDEFEERTRYIYAIEPDEPDCIEGEDHDWHAPYSVLGGLRENPGVWGHGGGVRATEVCAHCGTYQTTDSWAQDPETGEQGSRSTEYRDADEESMRWVRRRLAQQLPATPDGYALTADEDGDHYAIVREIDEHDVRLWEEDMREIVAAGSWDAIIAEMPEATDAD